MAFGKDRVERMVVVVAAVGVRLQCNELEAEDQEVSWAVFLAAAAAVVAADTGCRLLVAAAEEPVNTEAAWKHVVSK